MLISNKHDAVLDMIESMNIALDLMAQSGMGCACAGQKSTRGTSSHVQGKELRKSYSTFLDVQMKRHDLLHHLELGGEPVSPATVHRGDA